MNPNTFHNISYGVYVISSWDGDRPTGCTVNSIMQITSSPATLAVSVNHDNYTNGCIARTKQFSISILSEKSDPSIIGTFGFQSGREVNKYDKVPYDLADSLPIIKDACGYVTLKVIDTMETSTHTVFLGEVIGAEVLNDTDAMTYAYYHKVIKGKSPRNAPTYIETQEDIKMEAAKEAKKFICEVCGYIYEGDSLPADYVCPICGVGPEQFTEQ